MSFILLLENSKLLPVSFDVGMMTSFENYQCFGGLALSIIQRLVYIGTVPIRQERVTIIC